MLLAFVIVIVGGVGDVVGGVVVGGVVGGGVVSGVVFCSWLLFCNLFLVCRRTMLIKLLLCSQNINFYMGKN